MAEYLIQEETLKQIADAIRTKTGEEGEMTPVEMPEKIEGIKGLWEQIQDGTLTEWVDDEIIEMTVSPFQNCTSLEKVSCENLTSLPYGAFANNINLTEVNLPKLSVLKSSLGWGSNTSGYYFGDCPSLKTISFPELITVEGNDCFLNCSNLVDVYLPKMIDLRYGTFNKCNSLIQLDLPSVTTIKNNNPIENCSQLRIVKLPALKETKISVCTDCDALEIVDFTVLEKIPYGSCFDNCKNFKSLILRRFDKIVTLSKVFSNENFANGICYIYVPAALIEEYKSATNWSTYATQFRALEDYTVDGTITGELDETKIAEAAE